MKRCVVSLTLTLTLRPSSFSILHNLQARRPQKSHRTNDGGADTDIGSQAEDSGNNSS
ncbi:hypothetical protein BGZ65_009257, partial [Modicella reniformis]